MELGIVAQRDNERAVALATDLASTLADDVAVSLDAATGAAADVPGVDVGEMTGFPLVVSIGGDGTFLYVARNVGSTPILGVNLGEVGFLNAVSPDKAADRVREAVARIREHGAPRYREAHRVVATAGGRSVGPALNEITVQGPHRGRDQGIEARVLIDGAEYGAGRADGVLVATPTGSTAYNFSEGGPLVHPFVDALVVTRTADAAAMPPLVVDLEQTIEIEIADPERVVVTADGADREWIDGPTTVSVRTADEPARIAGPRADFFRALAKIG